MQPALYECSNTTTYDTVINAYRFSQNNEYYLGTLECIKCEHTEERNGENDLSLTILANSYLAKDVVPGNLILAQVPCSGQMFDEINYSFEKQFFKIYSVQRNLDTIDVQAHHISYELSYKPVTMFEGLSQSYEPYSALTDLFANTPNCPFNFQLKQRPWPSGTLYKFSVTSPGSLRKWLGGIEGSIMDLWPGEIYWNNLYVYYYQSRGSEKSKRIVYGVNLNEFSQLILGDEYYLNAVGYVEKDGVYVVGKTNNSPINNGTRWPVLDFTQEYAEQSSLPTTSQLINRVNKYIRDNNKNVLDVSLGVNYCPSKLLIDEPIFLCDTVNIILPKYGINTNLKVIKVVYDVLREKNISIELNQPKKTLADTVANLQIGQQNYNGATASANANRAAAQAANILLGNTE